MTASRNAGSRPRAKKWRSSHRKTMSATPSPAHGAMLSSSMPWTVSGAYSDSMLWHAALGAWSGGRFMGFGEAISEDRFAALLRPDEGIRTVMTADVYE